MQQTLGKEDTIVHLAFEAGRQQALEEVCAEEGHVESTNDFSGEEDGYVDVKCARCGKRLQ
jgi:hypothetical protein